MKCPRCQHENEGSAKFCEECAAPLVRTCANCGRHLSPTAKFCPECAHPVAVAGTPTTPRFTLPGSYTPKHLTERILTSKAALEGERKQVTVLFADLKGSMELLADRDPEEARKILDPVLERMMEAVHRYEGTVNQVMGDGIMALFGAPLAHEDHAVRACYAALRMQEAVKRYGEDVRRQEGVLPQIRVGLNSGEVVVRSIGSDLRMDYTAVGQTTHLAARMEQSAAPGTALLSTETLRLAEGYVQVAPLGPINVKGLADAVEAYELRGAVAGRSRFQALAARGLTKFVGRAAEIEQLSAALAQVRAGHGQTVAVVGEPGVGKSRLFWEFAHSHRTEGCLTVEAGSVSYGKATSYLPVIDLLRAYFQIEARDDQRKIREKVTGKLFSLDRALEPSLPPLLALLDVPVEDEEWTRLDPPQRRQRTLDGVKRLLLREAQVQPLVVVFEDLHWIDGETQALLDGLLESLPSAKILLLVNYRPEYAHAWSAKTYYRLLRIDPLPVETAEELLDALLGTSEELSPLTRLLIDRTQGNPFFLEESVRSLLETGALTGDRGSFRPARSLQMLQVPATAQAILAARIDRLEPEDKRLLQAASVIGKDIPLVLLEGIAGMGEAELRQGLSRLQAAEFLYETTLFPEVEYTFKHALTHEVTYSGLLQNRRRALHARIVEAIEELHADRLAEHVERLAHHAFRAEVWDEALPYLRQAGVKASTRSANREAVAYFEQALAALQHLPETRETLEQAIDIRVNLRASLWALGEFERMLGCLRETEDLARTLGDQRQLGWVSAFMSSYFWATGDSTQAHALAQAAQAIAQTVGDLPLRVGANWWLGATCFALGDYRGSEEFCRQNVESLAGDLTRERFGLVAFPAVLSRAWLVQSLAERGEFDEGIAYGQDGIRVAETLGHPFSMVDALWGLAYLYGVKGDLGQAVRLHERGVALCREGDIRSWAPLVTGSLGFCCVLSGRVEEGLSLLQQALTALESMGLRLFHSLLVGYLAEGYLRAERLQDASAVALRALTLARERGERGYEAWALRLLGEITSHGDSEVDTAVRHFREAMALADKLGMRPLVAHCHLGLGKLYRRTGKQEQAVEHLTTAMLLYREMDMTYWLENAGAEQKA